MRCTCEQARREARAEALREVVKKLTDNEHDASAVRMVLRMIDLPPVVTITATNGAGEEHSSEWIITFNSPTHPYTASVEWPDNPLEGGAI